MNEDMRDPTPQPYNEIVDLTPALAAAWLEKNDNNRPINWNYVSQLARDMKAGRFRCTHQGIAFDTEGRLIDGQHRLWAVLEADVTVRMRVFYNEPPENIVLIDGNCPRRAADRMSLGGALGTVRTDELATLRAMLGGISMVTKRRTIHEEMGLLEKHRPAVQFAHQHLAVARPAGIANSMTRAVVARAWYCVTLNVFLTRFCEVLRTGIPACDAEHVVVLLRDQLTGLRNQRTTSAARQRQYALTSRALSAYLRSESLSILRAPTFELFPLPEEVDSAA
jgi:hypothetical protein